MLAYGPQPVINSAGQILLHYYPLKDVGKSTQADSKRVLLGEANFYTYVISLSPSYVQYICGICR